jgi:hypothetical protein
VILYTTPQTYSQTNDLVSRGLLIRFEDCEVDVKKVRERKDIIAFSDSVVEAIMSVKSD